MTTNIIEREELARLARGVGNTSKIDCARMAMARKGVVNHWTLTYRRGPEGYFIFRNEKHPGVAPLP